MHLEELLSFGIGVLIGLFYIIPLFICMKSYIEAFKEEMEFIPKNTVLENTLIFVMFIATFIPVVNLVFAYKIEKEKRQ